MRFALVVLILVGGCSKKADTGPSCEKVVDAILALTKTQLQGHEGMNMGGDKKVMVDQCETRNLTPAQKTCMVAAKDLNGLAACTPPAKPPQ